MNPIETQETNRPDSDWKQPGFTQIQWDTIFWATVIVLIVVAVYSVLFGGFVPIQFIYLAKNFSIGKLSVDDMPIINPDYVLLNGHVYLPPGPFPAVLLIPFLPLLNSGLQPGWISILFTGANVFLLFRLLAYTSADLDKRKWMLLLFYGGTVYFSVATTVVSWYFGHVVGVTCLLSALLTTLRYRNHWLGGFVLGLAAACRLSILFAAPAFIFLIWSVSVPEEISKSLHSDRVRNLFKFAIGLSVPMALLLFYNYARFGTIFETGYGIDIVGSPALEEARRHGLFSIVHVPRNLFFLLLQGPIPIPDMQKPVFAFPYLQPSPMGMGIFFTSPALLLAFKASLKESLVKACWIGVVAVLVPVLSHYATGWIQFGFRYSLDFMPLLLLITCFGIQDPISSKEKLLIIASVVINLWGTAWLHTWLS